MIGFVHLKLSQLLMALYNPDNLQLGPQALERHRQTEVCMMQNYVFLNAFVENCGKGTR